MVALLPHKRWRQTTAPYMFLELLLAVKHELPILLLCEEGVKVQWHDRRNDILLIFGDVQDDQLREIGEAEIMDPGFRVPTLRGVHAVALKRSRFVNEPLMLPADLSSAGPSAMPSLMEEFISNMQPPRRRGSVFNVMPFAKEKERRIVAQAVYEETGLFCVNGSDAWAGAPFTREEIVRRIRESEFVIADLSGNSSACIFEAGVAVGADKYTYAITKTPQENPPFGPDQLHLLPYHTDLQLDQVVRLHCQPHRRRIFNVEISARAGLKERRNANEAAGRLVILLHGIRTQATWQEMVRAELAGIDDTEVVPIKYGFLDALRFWFPLWTRLKPLSVIQWKLEDAISQGKGRHVTVIAHSFGTYAVAQLLSRVATFRPDRILLCGAIIRTDFRWDQIENRPEILNDCGSRDVWPIFATAFSWGYGPSGTFGFGTPGIIDRYHHARHSEYFTRDFVERFWKPWIINGALVSSEHELQRPTPYWMSLLTVPIVRLVAVVLFLSIGAILLL